MTSNASIIQANRILASDRANSLELALEVSELRYRRLFETAQDGILILDAKEPRTLQVKEASQHCAAA
jgi:PAS domain-containing protein